MLKDEKNIFDTSDLTLKELKMRQLKEKAIVIAQKNTMEEKREGEYRVPENEQIDLRPAKDKKIKALYSRYQDVPNAVPDSQAWEKSQNTRAKGAYRTIDEIELKQKKNYEILVNNPINFIKKDIINRAKKQQVEVSSDSDSDSGSGSSSGASKRQLKQMKMQAKKNPMQLIKESLPIFKFRKELMGLIADNQVIIMVG